MLRTKTRSQVSLGAAMIIACWASNAAAQPAPSVQQLGESVRDRFVQSAKQCGAKLPFEPRVAVDPIAHIDVRYEAASRTIHFTDWKNLDAESRGLIQAWAAKGTLGLTPEGMYREMFNSFIAAHELGHYLQDVSGRYKGLSNWDSELEANRIGVAFWAKQPGPEGIVEARVGNITRFMDEVPNPVPPGDNAKDFLNRNYAAFENGKDGPLNPMTYSWIQSLMMKTALRERGQNQFCQLVRLNAAK